MGVIVAIETPLQDDVRHLVAALNEHLLPLSPIEFQFKMTVEQMAGADTTVFVARLVDGRAVGMGALRTHDAETGEIKRMFTDPSVRGQRVGVNILEAAIGLARQRGLRRLVLETGVGEGFAGAHRLYERYGFTPCDAVLGYPDSQWSAFYEMNLGAPAVAV